MLRIIVDPAPGVTPYHVRTPKGVTLARFKTRQMAESYIKSALLKIAMDLDTVSINRHIEERNRRLTDRLIAVEEETLP